MRALGIFGMVALLVALLTACSSSKSTGSTAAAGLGSGHAEQIDRSTFSGTWPFTVSSGILRCLDSAGAVTFSASNGTTYAINGTAGDEGAGEDVKSIWRKDPSDAGMYMYLGDVMDEGQRLCPS